MVENPQNIANKIAQSGHRLNFQVYKKVTDFGWEAKISNRYVDDVSGKFREIDIVASKTYKVAVGPFPELDLKFHLLIETKYIKEEKSWVLLTIPNTEPRDNLESVDRFIFSMEPNDFGKILDQISLSFHRLNGHRYFTKDVALLSVSDNDNEDSFFDATTAVIKAAMFLKNRTTDGKFDSSLNIYFPLVVYSGKVYTCSFEDSLKAENEIAKLINSAQDNHLARINYIEKMNFEEPHDIWYNPECYVDVVNKDVIDAHLQEIDNNINRLLQLLETRNNPLSTPSPNTPQ